MFRSHHAEPEWEREFRGFEASGSLPALSIVRLPNDHTRGTSPGAATPQSYVADNDLALGRLVEVVSHSTFWKDTAIPVTEDDAQNGSDHVDAHRTVALAISPFTQHGTVDSTHYSTSVNGAAAPMAKASASWDFDKADATPEIALNQAIWKSVKGKRSTMPEPRHAKIVGSGPNDVGDADG